MPTCRSMQEGQQCQERSRVPASPSTSLSGPAQHRHSAQHSTALGYQGHSSPCSRHAMSPSRQHCQVRACSHPNPREWDQSRGQSPCGVPSPPAPAAPPSAVPAIAGKANVRLWGSQRMNASPRTEVVVFVCLISSFFEGTDPYQGTLHRQLTECPT